MTQDWAIALERPADAAEIAALVTAAFAPMPYSDGSEARIIARLRADGDLTLSLVARSGTAIVGHIGFSPIGIGGRDLGWVQLAPLAVRVDRQRQGIGSALVRQGIAAMRKLGAAGIGVEGDPAYYQRFGFRTVAGLAPPGPHAAFYRALALVGEPPRGEVRYAAAFDPPDE